MVKKQLFIFLILTTLFSCKNNAPKTLNIAVAANMQFAMKKITHDFSSKTGIQCNLIVGSSGKLTAQIKEGAPFDIFASADMKYPNNLFQKGYSSEKPQLYAFGKLVLWSLKTDSLNFNALKKAKHIAISNPKTAPYGNASIEVLKNKELYKSVQNKLVYGESISQTNQFIISKSVDLGFTSKSVVMAPVLKDKGKWIDIPSNLYTPIAQGIILLNTSNQNAKEFYEYMKSNAAKKTLLDFGYSPTK